jgi:hypothetical protein
MAAAVWWNLKLWALVLWAAGQHAKTYWGNIAFITAAAFCPAVAALGLGLWIGRRKSHPAN